MSWIVVGVLGGGLLAGGGSAAGALLQPKPEGPDAIPGLGFDPSADPLLTANQVDLLASQGLFLPGQFEQAGPLEQAIQNLYSSSVVDPDLRVFLPIVVRRARDAIRAFEETGDESVFDDAGPFVDFLATQSGFDTLRELAEAQREFEEQTGLVEERLQRQAEQAQERSTEINDALTQLVGDFANFGDLREREEERLRRNALRQASITGSNPASLTRDADLQALTNAIGILGGQGQVASTLMGLDPANRAQQLGGPVTQLGLPVIGQGPAFIQQPQDTRTAQAVSGGLGAAGNTLTSFGLLQGSGLLGGTRPAAGNQMVSGQNFNPRTGQVEWLP